MILSKDPTRAEIVEYLVEHFPMLLLGTSEFDLECAIYWFAAHNYDGQTSDLYRVLCESPYHPGVFEAQPDPDSIAGMLYKILNEAIQH